MYVPSMFQKQTQNASRSCEFASPGQHPDTAALPCSVPAWERSQLGVPTLGGTQQSMLRHCVRVEEWMFVLVQSWKPKCSMSTVRKNGLRNGSVSYIYYLADIAAVRCTLQDIPVPCRNWLSLYHDVCRHVRPSWIVDSEARERRQVEGCKTLPDM
jgi:hypothetical protein